MKLKWYGHASFLITADNGLKIVTDPYTPETSGYCPVEDKADIVIRSSETDDFHNRADLIPGNPLVITAPDVAANGGQRVEMGITFQAMETQENVKHRGGHPELNAIYRFNVDGINIGHMGDVGNALNAEQTVFFEGLDVLLALTGGYPTIALPDLKVLIDHIQPRLVVPMHFRTLRIKLPNILWIQSFLDYFDPADVDFASDSEVTLTCEGIPKKTRVLVLDYA
jgi:L-ascorbate metabolism protein UlaG (beta-lactamase superfamily)